MVVLLVAGIIVAIMFLSRDSSDKQETREEYLKSLTKFVGGVQEPMEGHEDSYRIFFRHGGVKFIYEDVKEQGLGELVYSRGYIRAPAPFMLNLTFLEKSKSSLISRSSGGVVDLPEKLREFIVTTDKPVEVNKLFLLDDVVKVFAKFKDRDPRGHPVVSLDIKSGVLVLKLHSTNEVIEPNILGLQCNVYSIEDYLDKMLIVIEGLEEVCETDYMEGEL
jgi:hypothetical protein